MRTPKVLVTGAGGFIGGHLVRRLLDEGHAVRAVDIKRKHEWWQLDPRADNYGCVDLRQRECAYDAVYPCDTVYNLACNMGGMGFIELNKAACMLNVLINTHLLLAAQNHGVERFYFSSTACVYPQSLQRGTDNYGDDDPLGSVVRLREDYAYPADPEDGYGWEKLFAERMCRHFREDFGVETRIGRHHTTYGPYGSWCDGREKVPAALCRKVAEATLFHHPTVDVWGDGKQVRSFLYVDDAVDGILRVMESGIADPVNIGSEETVTVNELLSLVESIAGVELERTYDPSKPQGVRARCSDSTLLRSLGWEQSVGLTRGLEQTYEWVEQQVKTGLTTRA